MDNSMAKRKEHPMKRILILGLIISRTAFAGSVAGTGGSTEVTQIANNIELARQYDELYRQTKQLRDQLKAQNNMVTDMQRQGKSVSNQQWGSASEDLKQLSKTVISGQALAYSLANVDAKFRETYKGYDSYSKQKQGSSQTYSAQYAQWSKTNNDTITSAMRAANMQQQQFSSEAQTMKQIEQMGASAQGRMEAIQVGNMIAAQEVGQLQKLRALMAAQMQMQASFMARESDEQDLQKAEGQKYFDRKGPAPTVGNGTSF
jgi:P-type conjugative transfer protein TrbJ